jgi:hypothetical protein
VHPLGRRCALPVLLGLLLGFTGCLTDENFVELYGLEDTERLLVVTYPTYRNTRIDLASVPKDTGRWFAGKNLPALLSTLEGVSTAEQPDEAAPTFALVFFRDDNVSFKTVLLDQYLNFWPGFQFLGERYAGPYAEGPKELKWALLSWIWDTPGIQAYHVKVLNETAPKEEEEGGT